MIPAVWVALLLGQVVAPVDAARFGARPGAGGATNTKAIQQAVDAVGKAGRGTAAITQPGVYDLAARGPNPYQRGHRYCLDLRHDRLALSIGPGVTLRMADGQQADATGPVDVVVWRSRKDLRITGGGTITGNTAGQRGWTRGYAQAGNGTLLAGYAGADSNNERVTIDDVTLADHFSNAIAVSGSPESRDAGIKIANVRARDTGAGLLVMNGDDVTLEDVVYENDTVKDHPGNGLELSNVTRFLITRATLRGMLGGSGIALYGARYGTVDGFVIEGGPQGMSIAENNELHTYSDRVQVKNGTIRLVAAGTGVFTKGVRVRDVTLSNVKVLGPSVAGSIGFQISSDNVTRNPSDDWRQEGPVTLEGCEAHGLDIGLLIKTVANLSVKGGDYSDNRATPHSDGILWMGQGNARAAVDTRGLLMKDFKATGNRRFGLHLDSQGLRDREPQGFLMACSLAGNGVEGYHLTREVGHEFVKDLWVDGPCFQASAAFSSAPQP